MRLWLRAHGTTAAAILVAGMLTAWFGYMSLGSLLGAIDPERLDQEFGRGVLSAAPAGSTADAGGAAANASAIVGIVIGAIVLLSAITIVGLMFRGAWAREAGLVIYGLLGFVATAASLGGLAADPPAPSAWAGMFIGLTNFAIVGLLLAPATARDYRGR
ncbi:MAG: hypothetical protein U9R51_02465 [Actinomycetota bacterium]|nr:hypothetical protein [Actinomycetota bacterium]